MSDLLRVLSFGAGRQTVALARMALEGAHGLPPLDAMIFADTGAEMLGTYRAAALIEVACERQGVRFLTVRCDRKRSSGSLFNDLMGVGVDSQWSSPPLFVRNPDGSQGFTRRQCTSDFKIDPIMRAIRELAGIGRRRKFDAPVVECWHGISADERQRMRLADRPWYRLRYPLIECGLNLGDCILWLERNGHEVPPKSACFFCPYQSDRRWKELRDHHPGLWADAVQLDAHLRTNPGAGGLKGTPYLHRSCRPLPEVSFDDTGDLFADECAGVCGV